MNILACSFINVGRTNTQSHWYHIYKEIFPGLLTVAVIIISVWLDYSSVHWVPSLKGIILGTFRGWWWLLPRLESWPPSGKEGLCNKNMFQFVGFFSSSFLFKNTANIVMPAFDPFNHFLLDFEYREAS